ISPFLRIPSDCSTTGPETSEMNISRRPSTPSTSPWTKLVDMVELRSPFGRPKWASNSTLAPASASSSMVGATARTRVRSVAEPSFIGRLRSTRTSATLPATSPRSSRVLNPAIAVTWSEEACHHLGSVDHPVGETPFIIVPAHHTGKLAFHHRGLKAVDCRTGRPVVEVAGDERLVGIVQHAFHLPVRGRLERGV